MCNTNAYQYYNDVFAYTWCVAGGACVQGIPIVLSVQKMCFLSCSVFFLSFFLNPTDRPPAPSKGPLFFLFLA